MRAGCEACHEGDIPVQRRGKRLLGLWDYKALPWSVGDVLLFVEALSLRKLELGAEGVDICIVYDADRPDGNRRDGSVTPENVQARMMVFLPLFRMCPDVGAIFQFNDRRELYHFLRQHMERYDLFPSLTEHLTETYNFTLQQLRHIRQLQDFYAQQGFIPHLRVAEADLAWARDFFSRHLPPGSLPVAVSMRQPASTVFCPWNAVPEVWLGFFDRCAVQLPEVVFVLIGTSDEVLPEFRLRPNVRIAKDLGSSLMEDIALMRASTMYVATCSGINMAAWFSDLPYLIVQHPEVPLYHLKDPCRMGFAHARQKVFSMATRVTTEFLFCEFSNILGKVAACA